MKGVTRSTELIKVVKVWGERGNDSLKGEVERKLDRRRHEHIFLLQIIRFPQVADLLKQTARAHSGPPSPGKRCKLRRTCRNTNTLTDITDVHGRTCARARTHTFWKEEQIPEATGGSGDSNQEDFDLPRASVIATEMESLDQARFQLITMLMPRHRNPLAATTTTTTPTPPTPPGRV